MHPADIDGFSEIGHSDLNGFGDGMQVMPLGDTLYVAHFGPSGKGTSILDISDPAAPQVVRQWDAPPGSHTHKVQVADGLLLVNHELFRSDGPAPVGMAVYDLSDPFDPTQVGFFDTGGRGVHRIVYEGGDRAYISAVPPGYTGRIWLIVDVSDPANPTEVGRWWWPGMWEAGGETPDWPDSEDRIVHHAMVHDDRAYVGFWDSGMVIVDIADPTRPTTISRLSWEEGGHTHTCLPLPDRDLVVVTDEAITDGCDGPRHMVRVVDVSDETRPFVRSICPVPEGDFCDRGLRFGAHCLHENRPGSYRSQELMFVTYFNAGLRVYDVSDPDAPAEVAHWIPECPPGQAACQINDLFVAADHTVYATDRVNGGVYILEPTEALSQRMAAAAW
ncbi:MAG: LVIVD repeat-containing protein [Actinomycetota bacterium]